MKWSLAQDNDDETNDEWVIIKYRYHEHKVFQIFDKDGVEIVPAYPMDIDKATGEVINLDNHTATCGKAIYDNTVDTLHIVLNKRGKCIIDIKMVSSI